MHMVNLWWEKTQERLQKTTSTKTEECQIMQEPNECGKKKWYEW